MAFDLPFELIDQIERDNCVLFVGAGLSMDAGLPGWKQLLLPLCQILQCSPDSDPLKVAQVFQHRYSRRNLIEHILEQTDTTGKKIPISLLNLARMRFKTWITTNYDNLVEKALDKCDQSFIKVVSDKDLAFDRSDKTTIIKLHGDREQPDTIIITRQDFDTGLWKSRAIREEISHLLRKKTFLFVGYSLNDPDFNQVHSQIQYDFGGYVRRSYAVLFDLDSLTLSDLSSRGIETIVIPSAAENASEYLRDFITALYNELSLMADVSKREHFFPDANGRESNILNYLNEQGIISAFENRSKRIVKCEEYLIHSPVTEAGLNNPIDPQRLARFVRRRISFPSECIEEYQRTDKEGNIWLGFAIGL